MPAVPKPPALSEMRRLFGPYCEKHGIQRLEVFGSASRGDGTAGSDVDLLVTLDPARSVSTDALLEMAGEAEELLGRRVDFVLRSSLGKSPNQLARENILRTAVPLYGCGDGC